jgi:ABC-type antimicrobial peptide transport system permease subunit
VYELISQGGPPYACYFIIRTAVDPISLSPALRSAMREIEPSLSISDFKTLDSVIDEGLASERILARSSSFFAGAALFLAAIGLFGVMSFSVARRTGEIGVRIALGARRASIMWLVVRETLCLTLVGIVAGLGASLSLMRLINSLLFGLEPTDPVAMAAAFTLMLSVSLVAGYLPARKASSVDPMIALRHE